LKDIETVDQMAAAIKDMHLRGAGLIGAAAGFGMYLATLEAPENDAFDQFILRAADQLKSTRPTAVNLAWAVDKQLNAIQHGNTIREKINIAFTIAIEIADEDAEHCRRIGEHGLNLIEAISKNKNGGTVNILTHCNAGWLAFVDYGSASSPYMPRMIKALMYMYG
jgi:methylthioribose-1-phosphate isomerase